jgi:hypothetical protein
LDEQATAAVHVGYILVRNDREVLLVVGGWCWPPFRRLMWPADAPPLGTILSLAYFLPVIEEVLELRVSPDYFDYLRYRLARAGSTR